MKVLWFAPYNLALLQPALALARPQAGFHPCSWIVNLAAALAARGDVELTIATESPAVAGDQIVRQNQITFHVLQSGIPLVHRNFPPWLPVETALGFLPNVRRLRAVARQVCPDIVHAHGTEVAFARAAQATGLPAVISIQGIISEIYKTDPTFSFWLKGCWERKTVRRGRG